MFGHTGLGLVALATGVLSAPAKRQAPSGVPDYVLKYGMLAFPYCPPQNRNP